MFLPLLALFLYSLFIITSTFILSTTAATSLFVLQQSPFPSFTCVNMRFNIISVLALVAAVPVFSAPIPGSMCVRIHNFP